MHGRRAWGMGVGALGLCLAASCGTDDDELIVLAASSLADVMTEIEIEFETMYEGVDVRISLAGSNALRTQVEQGAPADVVAFADTAPMDELIASGDIDAWTVFATNSLVLVTPADDPGDVDSIDDLADADLTIGLCAPTVPCGSLAVEALAANGVDPALDTEEPDVRSLVAKIVQGELDAGLVYATDAVAFAGDLRIVGLDTSPGAINRYPIAVLNESDQPDLAARFVDLVLSGDGAAVLADAGFGAP